MGGLCGREVGMSCDEVAFSMLETTFGGIIVNLGGRCAIRCVMFGWR